MQYTGSQTAVNLSEPIRPQFVECPRCEAKVPMLPIDLAAIRFGTSRVDMKDLIESGQAHCTGRNRSHPAEMICIPSIMDALQR